MAEVPDSRRVGRMAVNAVRSLLERHDHIVHEVDGSNDFGEDLIVEFVSDGQRDGNAIRAQIKGGASYRSARGYRVPIGKHEDDWSVGNIPVICVVYDPDLRQLFWANATFQIREAKREMTRIRSVKIRRNSILDDDTVNAFARATGGYAGRFKGDGALRSYATELCGVNFAECDVVLHFRNEHYEDLIFWQRPHEDFATMLHSDLGWEPVRVRPGDLDFDGLSKFSSQLHDRPAWVDNACRNVPTIKEVILEHAEALWLSSCFSATAWRRRPA